jgi:hypothetical protein
MLLHEAGCWTLNKQETRRTESTEAKFLTDGYKLTGRKTIKIEEFGIFNLKQKLRNTRQSGCNILAEWMKGESTVNTLLSHRKNSRSYSQKIEGSIQIS